MIAKARAWSVFVALIIHVVVYSVATHPMMSGDGDLELRHLAVSTLFYFPVSLGAWGFAYITHSTGWFLAVLAAGGALWYGFIGYRVGARIERRTTSQPK